ncbi:MULTISPECIES: excinuclease ABC subunit UvrC [Halobacteriovorax]|uniref:UvrABC system protein C n=1 Tax=Halobacteriovorax vibrionivorans TaxID=2152716 RepID=A0ABY0IKB4_9BACT|nr:excinuclease ABC subunit UvrC [Halobacteriovorax vibrionivorans]RZF21999.1 excinuclease ABC subunit UvrC [Halobacteriovorax vibrionivorans]
MKKNTLQLLEKAKHLPTKSGCYLMKRKRAGVEEILYIGKAKNLRARVSSYFNSSEKSPKTQILVSHIQDFDFIMTKTDAEAYILENNLIKKHIPKYNIQLKDDKSYPYIQIDLNEKFPRLVYTRRPKRKKKVRLFGPFTTGSNIHKISRILTKSFTLRDCSIEEMRRRKRPCLIYQMRQCSAPCVDYISREDYEVDLNNVINFFEGRSSQVLKTLEERMFKEAEKEHFERAAEIRDSIEELKEFSKAYQKQNVELSTEKDFDIAAYHVGELEVDISIYMMRSGILLGHKNFHFGKGDSDKENHELFQTFLFQYYSNTKEKLPSRIYIDEKKNDLAMISEAFKEVVDEEIEVQKPIGKMKSLYELTYDHAKEHQRFRVKNMDGPWIGLNKLKELLKLKETPKILECFDVAIWQGKSPTASQIVFRDGKPDKTQYRYYHLEERPEGNNDFAMMREVLARRLKKGKLPDVFIVDGGKGQVSSFLAVLEDFELDIPVVGIAKIKTSKSETFKDKEVSSSDERLIIPNRINPYILKKTPSLMRIVVQMRDEAHRFSRKLHHKKEKDRIFTSWFDDIEGIGEKTLKTIHENMDLTLKELAQLSLIEISHKLNVKESIAERIQLKLLKEFPQK